MPAFSNQATLSYSNGTVVSNAVTGEVVDILSATKNALDENYGAGDTITYVVNITNTGTAPYNGVTVNDDLGAYNYGTQQSVPLTYEENSLRYFVNGELQTAPSVTVTDNSFTVNGVNVPAGGNAQIIYQARVNGYAPLGENGAVTNTATVTTPNNRNVITASDTIPARNGPDLSIVKAVSPGVVPENGTLTYTFTISNNGNEAAEADDNVVVTDTFNPALNITSVTLNGASLAENTGYTYDADTGEFATTAGAITVPAATFTQNTATGEYTTAPGTAVLTVTGTIQ